MRHMFRAALIGVAIIVSGCVNAPPLKLNAPIEGNDQGKVARTIDHIACELAEVKSKHSPRFDNYAAVAQLTMKIESSAGVTPSLGFIKPLAVAGTSRSKSIGGEFSRGRMKTFSQNFILITDELILSGDCDNRGDPVPLTDRLGLEEVVLAGLNAISDDAHGRKWANEKGKAAAAPQFGSTIQFTTKMGANGGPSIAKTRFKGYGGSNGLLNASQTNTDILVIAFAPVSVVLAEEPPAKQRSLLDQLIRIPRFDVPLLPMTPQQEIDRDDQARRNAINEAQRLLNNMILQNINSIEQ